MSESIIIYDHNVLAGLKGELEVQGPQINDNRENSMGIVATFRGKFT